MAKCILEIPDGMSVFTFDELLKECRRHIGFKMIQVLQPDDVAQIEQHFDFCNSLAMAKYEDLEIQDGLFEIN